jgi:hypothetical protein
VLTQGFSHTLAPVGQILIQAQHKIHTFRSVKILSLTVIAAVGQALAHASHFVHRVSSVIGDMLGGCISSL